MPSIPLLLALVSLPIIAVVIVTFVAHKKYRSLHAPRTQSDVERGQRVNSNVDASHGTTRDAMNSTTSPSRKPTPIHGTRLPIPRQAEIKGIGGGFVEHFNKGEERIEFEDVDLNSGHHNGEGSSRQGSSRKQVRFGIVAPDWAVNAMQREGHHEGIRLASDQRPAHLVGSKSIPGMRLPQSVLPRIGVMNIFGRPASEQEKSRPKKETMVNRCDSI